MRIRLAGFIIGVLAAGSAWAQYVISAHSGVIQAADGRTFLNGQLVELKFGQFPDIKDNQVFRTEEGRAEILLTPGVFLRLGENSSIRMISNQLTDTRVEVLSGSAMVECDSVLKNESKDNAVTLLYKGTSMLLVKRGLYRVDTDQARLQVYDGEAIVRNDSGQLTVKSGKQTALDGALMAENFDKKQADELYLWSNRRSSYLAQASASSAMSLRNSSGGYSPWQWNSMFGLFTFVPYSGIAYSPFGWSFWSPYSVLAYYYYPRYYGYRGGSIGNSVSSFTPYSASQLGYATGIGRMSSAAPVSGGFGGGGYSAPSAGGGMGAGGGAVSGGGRTGGAGGGGAAGHGR